MPTETLPEWATRAAAWYRKEWERRTEAIRDGQSTNIDWLDPEYRICWSEVQHFVPRPNETNVVDARLAFAAALKKG